MGDLKSTNFISGVVEGFYGKPWTFNQRKDLFDKLKTLGLNTFLYGPKDDRKHRAEWRKLYDENEARDLKALIDEAKAKGIDFYYSLSPGLDMTFSDRDELDLLVKKYDQIAKLGCECFAILFDDIKPTISNEADKKVFKDYASAQVSVTNYIYEHLNRPKFLFCPTEYCESKAIPDVPNSSYLSIIGDGLSNEIGFLWSGSRVISKLITGESIDALTKVIKRPPVIWENLHANDYDKKRVFLGPFSGRSTNLIPKLKGILTNPNCEYELNYIAIHTLANWTKCTQDINCNNRPNRKHLSVSTDTHDKKQSSESVYDPDYALMVAIKDWLPFFMEHKALQAGLDIEAYSRQDEAAFSELIKTEQGQQRSDENAKDVEIEDGNVEMVSEGSRSSSGSGSTSKNEMDTSNSNAFNVNQIDTNSCESCDMRDVAESNNNISKTNQECIILQKCPSTTTEKMNDILDDPKISVIDSDLLYLLVDLFYLPFEHGSRGYELLNEMQWIRDNSDVFSSNKDSECKDDNDAKMNVESINSENQKTVENWEARTQKLNHLCSSIKKLVKILINDCPNRLIITELYPYLADLRDMCSTICDYIEFLRYRKTFPDRYNLSPKESQVVSSEEQEPWVHWGGLFGDVQRLISHSDHID